MQSLPVQRGLLRCPGLSAADAGLVCGARLAARPGHPCEACHQVCCTHETPSVIAVHLTTWPPDGILYQHWAFLHTPVGLGA